MTELTRIPGPGRRPMLSAPVSKKLVKWSHQAELDRLKGKKIAYRLNHMDDGDWQYATLVDADQFAIKVLGQFFTTEQQSTLIYFKHQIAVFAAA